MANERNRVDLAVFKMSQVLEKLCTCSHPSHHVTADNIHEHVDMCKGKKLYEAVTLVMEAREDGNLTDTILKPIGTVTHIDGHFAVAGLEGTSFADLEGKTLYARI